ncbi:MAG: glycosyl amidation-associated protein WbuZ [Cyanobacteria bacterium P01_E01_bin.42]
MLKVRIIPTLLFKNFGLVKGVRFDSWRRVGSAMQSVKVYNLREVDELIFLDISATGEERPPDFETVDEIADECFMPLTVGGGIRNIADIRKLLAVGADKVSLNTAAVLEPEIIREAAREFGSQCVVASIDVKQMPNGSYEVFTHAGTQPTGKHPATWAREVEALGAGEILLTAIDRDGTMAGYDLELIQAVTQAISIPAIASGGAGNYEHFLEAFRDGGASAVAAASIYHFTEQTPLEAKRFLQERGIHVRL